MCVFCVAWVHTLKYRNKHNIEYLLTMYHHTSELLYDHIIKDCVIMHKEQGS